MKFHQCEILDTVISTRGTQYTHNIKKKKTKYKQQQKQKPPPEEVTVFESEIDRTFILPIIEAWSSHSSWRPENYQSYPPYRWVGDAYLQVRLVNLCNHCLAVGFWLFFWLCYISVLYRQVLKQKASRAFHSPGWPHPCYLTVIGKQIFTTIVLLACRLANSCKMFFPEYNIMSS